MTLSSNPIQHIVPSISLTSLDLPSEAFEGLKAIVSDLGGSGTPRSTVALFVSNNPLNASTAAEAVAHGLGRGLARVQPGAVSRPQVAEAENNLAQVIQATDSEKWILFFDEGDSLFSKRSVVRGATESDMNIDSAPLVERLQSYLGLSIVAATASSNLANQNVRYTVHLPDQSCLPKGLSH